eukprot:743236-Rhodomonas_salina.1
MQATSTTNTTTTRNSANRAKHQLEESCEGKRGKSISNREIELMAVDPTWEEEWEKVWQDVYAWAKDKGRYKKRKV